MSTTQGYVAEIPGLLVPEQVAVHGTVKLVREWRGILSKDLAELMGVSPGYISKIESGRAQLMGPKLEAAASALEVSPELLCRPVPVEPTEGTHFRSQSRTPQWQRNKVRAQANMVAFMLNKVVAEVGVEFPRNLPSHDVDRLSGGAVEAAQLVRSAWRIGDHVMDLAAELESAGVFILEMTAGMDAIDAITVRTPGPVRAVVLLRPDVPEDRKRHSLAHELGHLVMDLDSPHGGIKEVEQRADLFAGEFLAPYEELHDVLRGITPSQLQHVQALSTYWGVSIPSLIKRAHLHGDLTDQQYRYWFKVLNARNLIRGPRDCSFPIQPRAAHDALNSIRVEFGYSAAELKALTDVALSDWSHSMGSAWPFRPTRPKLHLVTTGDPASTPDAQFG
ncbi:XRE family transcriptional regulator [Kytococcus schroeteri]|uniref:XRE family transcriptional regulator n=1 Tax=Kytococcus schroeteri TaxID=138300 RepID=UPI0035E6E05C